MSEIKNEFIVLHTGEHVPIVLGICLLDTRIL